MFGFEQLLHGHGPVEMVFDLGDLFTGVFADTRCSAQFDEWSRVVPKMVVRLARPPSRTCSTVRRKAETAP